jgi:hypothetical protein
MYDTYVIWSYRLKLQETRVLDFNTSVQDVVGTAHQIQKSKRMVTFCSVVALFTAVLVATFMMATSDSFFDVVIVGAGPAGSAVAYHLGKLGLSVLLVEAGGPSQRSTGGDEYLLNDLTIFGTKLCFPMFFPRPLVKLPPSTVNELARRPFSLEFCISPETISLGDRW